MRGCELDCVRLSSTHRWSRGRIWLRLPVSPMMDSNLLPQVLAAVSLVYLLGCIGFYRLTALPEWIFFPDNKFVAFTGGPILSIPASSEQSVTVVRDGMLFIRRSIPARRRSRFVNLLAQVIEDSATFLAWSSTSLRSTDAAHSLPSCHVRFAREPLTSMIIHPRSISIEFFPMIGTIHPSTYLPYNTVRFSSHPDSVSWYLIPTHLN